MRCSRVSQQFFGDSDYKEPGLVVKKTPEYYLCYRGDRYDSQGPDLLNFTIDYIDSHEKLSLEALSLNRWLHGINNNFDRRDAAGFLAEVDNLYKIFGSSLPTAAPKEKLNYLQRNFAKVPHWENPNYCLARRNFIDKFLVKFEYHKQMMENYPDIKAIQISPALAKKHKKKQPALLFRKL